MRPRKSAGCILSSNHTKVRGAESRIGNAAQERTVTNNVCGSKNMRFTLLPRKENTKKEEFLTHRISAISMENTSSSSYV